MASYCIATSWEGSLAKHFRALAGELARRAHRVFLLVPHRRHDLVDETANPAVLTWPSMRPTRWADATWFARFLRSERPRVLVANFGATNIMLSIGAAFGIPVRLAWYHTLSEQQLLDGERGWQRHVLLWRKQLVYRAATHFATASEAARADLARVYHVRLDRITTVGYSLSDPGVRSEGVPAAELVCVGRMHPSKGQDVLLHALALLPDDVRLILIGDGPARPRYQALAEQLGVASRCRFVGSVAPEDVSTWMARSMITIVPSRTEAFGLVNIESLAVGTPVVASRVGGIPEIVREGVDGFLVPPDDPAALAEALAGVLRNPETRRRLSANARQRFVSSYEQRTVVARQAAWLESLG